METGTCIIKLAHNICIQYCPKLYAFLYDYDSVINIVDLITIFTLSTHLPSAVTSFIMFPGLISLCTTFCSLKYRNPSATQQNTKMEMK